MDDVAAPVCRHCGGLLAESVSLTGARRCLTCGKGTILPCGEDLQCGHTCGLGPFHDGDHKCAPHCLAPKFGKWCCGKQLDCGGTCYLPRKHEPPCMCEGDVKGAGTCPG